MVLRLRQPRRGRFSSHLRESRRRKREYYYASMLLLVVKIVLLISLSILFSVSIRLFRHQFKGLPATMRYAIPVIVAIFAVILIYFIYKNIKELMDSGRNSSEKY